MLSPASSKGYKAGRIPKILPRELEAPGEICQQEPQARIAHLGSNSGAID
jgi:hypothetical protein